MIQIRFAGRGQGSSYEFPLVHKAPPRPYFSRMWMLYSRGMSFGYKRANSA
jgi:hypothetical protein